jgi:leucyl/phenylalanyl-tRNA--protein transferase
VALFRLDPRFPELFPDPIRVNGEGPACFGGDLTPERLFAAYRLGYFPWFAEGEPTLWWHPNPRFVLFPDELRVSKSMRPYFNQRKYRVTYDRRFREVMEQCRSLYRPGQFGSWITDELIEGYVSLHELGIAHSVEVYEGEELVGGLYGLAMGRVFFGESMFFHRPNASKFGFISLVRRLAEREYRLVDCQQETAHLASLGARAIPRSEFLDHLTALPREETERGKWT